MSFVGTRLIETAFVDDNDEIVNVQIAYDSYGDWYIAKAWIAPGYEYDIDAATRRVQETIDVPALLREA